MFTTTKPKMTSIVASSPSHHSPTSSSKSCGRCQEIYDSLSTHIIADHALTNINDSILNNVLLNILSLLSGNASEATIANQPPPRQGDLSARQEESAQLVPVTVISKPEKQRRMHSGKDRATSNSFASPAPIVSPVSQENSNVANVANEINNSSNLQLTTLQMNNVQLNNSQISNTQIGNTQINNPQLSNRQISNTPLNNAQINNSQINNQQLTNQQLNNQQLNNSSGIPSRLSFQPDLISSLFSSLPQPQKMQGTQSVNSNRPNLIQPKLLQVQDSFDISFMVPPNNDFQSAAGLIAADGSLTPAGISFLLANQNKGGNSSGKSDLDVADILVNKMPIPSLNKALDPGLLQLSTLYLQQLAMSQQQISNNAAGTVDFTSELMNITKTDDHQNPNIPSKSSIKNNQQNNDSSEQAESLQQLIARHKQISGLIDALSTQQKTTKKAQVKTESYDNLSGSAPYTINPQGLLESSISSISLLPNNRQNAPVPLTLPPAMRQVSAAIKTNGNGKPNQSNPIVITSTSKKGIPIIWDPVSSNLLNLVKQHAKATVNDVNFEDVKSDDNMPVNAVASTAKLQQHEIQTLHNLIIENPKNVVVVTNSKDTETVDSESEAVAKLKYSAVTMVPVSQLGNSVVDTDMKNIKSKVLYKCNVCGITFSVVSTLQAHLKTHIVERKEQCNYCQLSFTNKEEYYTHVLSHRGEENVFTCQFCQKIFTSKGDYNKHVTKHTQRRPYLCSHCHKAFRDPGSLTKHERIHTGEQPYVCEICHRGFAEKSSLRKHVRVHSGEQPYRCNQCDKSFSISGNLQRHLFIHTGLRPFKCTECAKAFNNPSHLRRHVKNLHKKIDGGVEAKPTINNNNNNNNNNNLVFPRIMNTVAGSENEHEEDDEAMKD